jgi:hypothetical protein
MATFILEHTHVASECRVAFAAWRGFDSPLRHEATLASCASQTDGRHMIVWTVESESEAEALAQLPPYVAERTAVTRVNEVRMP